MSDPLFDNIIRLLETHTKASIAFGRAPTTTTKAALAATKSALVEAVQLALDKRVEIKRVTALRAALAARELAVEGFQKKVERLEKGVLQLEQRRDRDTRREAVTEERMKRTAEHDALARLTIGVCCVSGCKFRNADLEALANAPELVAHLKEHLASDRASLRRRRT